MNNFLLNLEDIKKYDLRKYINEKYGMECNSNNMLHCPFHPPDRNPSLSIFENYDGIWMWVDHHVLGGEEKRSGTIIDFVAKIENISIKDACIKLLEEFNEKIWRGKRKN